MILLIVYIKLSFLDGTQEKVFFDKISSRINILCKGLDENYVDPPKISQKVTVRPDVEEMY